MPLPRLRRLAPHFQALACLAIALFAACSGGGGGGGTLTGLLPGVDLSGPWSWLSTVTAVDGSSCAGTVGATGEETVQYTFDPATGELIVVGSFGEIRGLVRDRRVRLLPTAAPATAGVLPAAQQDVREVELSFFPEGTTSDGTRVFVDAGSGCVTTQEIIGDAILVGEIAVTFDVQGVAPLLTAVDLTVTERFVQPVDVTSVTVVDILSPGDYPVEITLPEGLGYTVVEGTRQIATVQRAETTQVRFTIRRETTAVAWLDFAGDLMDRTGNGHDGTIFGDVTIGADRATFTDGRIELDRSEDFRMNSSDAFTYSVRIQSPGLVDGAAVFAKAPAGAVENDERVIALYLDEATPVHDVYFFGELRGGTVSDTAFTTVTVVHVGQTATLFVEGVAAYSRMFLAGNEGDRPWLVTLGQSLNQTFPGAGFVGDMEEFVFFARALTSQEVAQLHADGPAGL